MDPATKGSDRRHLPQMTVTATIGSFYIRKVIIGHPPLEL
jgi:hypothetical protein